MASISPFNILLNNLSSDLSKLNLHNLVNVCGELISEVERERISSGWDVFLFDETQSEKSQGGWHFYSGLLRN